MRPFEGRRILLIVSGGIAAYKSVHLLRSLNKSGADVDVVMTEAAERMVGPVTFEALAGRPVYGSLWTEPLAHIELGREAELIVVAPATANLLAKLTHGLADDLASATLLAAAAPVLAAPAMNTRMWMHPATQENVQKLVARGVELVGPEDGPLAERESGVGRMAESDTLLAHIGRRLEEDSPLAGRKVVVTAGPTREPIDAVRYIGNRSSGRMGFALAASAWRRGADVVVICGSTAIPPPTGPRVERVETAGEMLEALERELEGAALLVMAAAVSDFRNPERREGKIKKERGGLELQLEPGPDLLAETRERRKATPTFTLGFALETENGVENARRKRADKGLDMVALNFADDPDGGFDVPTNRITIVTGDEQVEELPLLEKSEVADRLLDRIEEHLA